MYVYIKEWAALKIDPSINTMKLILFVLSVVVIVGGYEIKCCPQNERAGLIQIRDYFSSVSDTEYVSDPFASWGEKSNCCEWERVKCSPSSGHITHLFLNSTVSPHEGWPLDIKVFYSFQHLTTLHLSNNRIASLVQIEGLGTLNNLQDLDLSSNEIAQLPDFLWNVPSLRSLDLSRCQLTGQLDARLCRLSNARELHFPNNQLDGSLPDCVRNLTSLQVLDLLDNSFTGSFPSTINLPSLEWLSIQGNNFQGNFPLSSLTNHSSLKVLMLSNNAIQVQIEESLSLSTMQLQVLGLANCNMSIHTNILQKFLHFQSNLQYIDLSSNSLVGSFPTWLLQNNSDLKLLYLGNNSLTGVLQLPQGNNPSLVSLDISNNQFSAEIPYHIGMTLSALKLLQMSNNSFHGPIPSSLSNMTQLEILDLSNNKLSGEVPNSLFSDCSNLGVLVLSNNSLDGEIIPSNMNLSSLYVLSLYNNNFSGTVKESLKISTVLEYLDISSNKVTGDLPSWIGGFSQMKLMLLARNNFHGSIPSQICNIASLQYLDLSENRFTGEFPSCDSASLVSLHLHGNNLNGAFPKGLKGCSNLKVLDLSSNQISGDIPSWIQVLSDLAILLLGDNQLQGELPIQLCQLQHLNIVDVSNNSISGAIPSCFGSLSFGAEQGDYVGFAEDSVLLEPSSTLFKLKNHYVFRDDVERGGFKFEKVGFTVKSRYDSYKGKVLSIMSVLDLSCNQISGYIPPELGDLTKLNTLNLSRNHLSGPIPESFSELHSVESLDLSWNELSGNIPWQLVDLNFLGVFNVSYNNLSGQVPKTGQFGDYDENNYRGNPLLYGYQLANSCTVEEPPSSPSAEPGDEGGDSSAFDWHVFFWSFGASFIMVLFTLFAVLYINPGWRRAWFAFLDYHLLWWL